MTRIEFSKRIVELLHTMTLEEEDYIIDYVKRSDEEQIHLYQEGKSKCDGIHDRSAHQDGKAMDIYWVKEGKLISPKAGWEYWHKLWVKRGGKPEISWDRGHFE